MLTIANFIFPSGLTILQSRGRLQLAGVGRCIEDIREWMLNDKLKLNDDKTEFIIIGTSQQLAKVSITTLRVRNATITPVSSARNLGSWFASKLTMAIHIPKTCNSAFIICII